MGPSRDDRPIKFATPPVRRVVLTLPFRADGPIQASHVAPLRVAWADELPLAEEAPPLAPFDDAEGPAFIGPGETWPLPFTRYSTNDGDLSIAFQSDRFLISWAFDPDAPQYPGFDALAGELERRFGQLRDRLSDVGISITVEGARCDYLNALEQETAAQTAVGVLTDWTAEPSARVTALDFIGVHLHPCDREDEHGCNAVLSTETMAGGATLRVSVERSGMDDGADELDALRAAHDELVSFFLDYTTDEQKRRWNQL